MSYDRQQVLELILSDICEERGLEHARACYEEIIGNVERGTFWVCKPGCPTLLAKKILQGVIK